MSGNAAIFWPGQTFANPKSGLPSFVSYTPYSLNNNLHLASNDTAARGQGLDLSAQFNTDFDGQTRTVPWDIGADEAGGGPVPSPTPTPTPTPTPPPFAVGGRIELTSAETNVRSAPVIDPANLLGVQPLGVLGTLLEGPSTSADGVVWWRIDFDSGTDGWSGTDNYVSTTKPPPSPTPTPSPTATPTPTPGPTPPLQIQISDVQGLQEALDGKAEKGHQHVIPEAQTLSP